MANGTRLLSYVYVFERFYKYGLNFDTVDSREAV